MVKRNSAGQDYTNNADGFTLGGGSTQRNLSLTGADVTLTGSGSNTYNFPASSDTLVGRDSIDTLKNKDLTDPSNTLPAATSASKLDTARSLQVNLASASAQSFDGSANATNIGVSGTLPVGRGGTGATSFMSGSLLKGNNTSAISTATAGTDYVIPSGSITGNAGTATKLSTARSLQVNLASASAQTFDGSANATSIGVSGTLPVNRGGTGATSFTSGNYLVGSGTGAVSSVASIPVTDIGTGVVKGSNNGTATTLTLWKGTLAQYNALGSYDSNTVYVIT